MELKKYVMLNNNKVYDLTNEDDFNKYQTVKNGSHWDLQVKKRSGNILDLVEVGDLVKPNYENRIYLVLNVSKTMLEIRGVKHFVVEEKGIYIVENCVEYFWKLQPNGDYKRYEVK